MSLFKQYLESNSSQVVDIKWLRDKSFGDLKITDDSIKGYIEFESYEGMEHETSSYFLRKNLVKDFIKWIEKEIDIIGSSTYGLKDDHYVAFINRPKKQIGLIIYDIKNKHHYILTSNKQETLELIDYLKSMKV